MYKYEIENQVERVIKYKISAWGINPAGYVAVISTGLAIGCIFVLLTAMHTEHYKFGGQSELKQNTTFCYRSERSTYMGYNNYVIHHYNSEEVDNYINDLRHAMRLDRIVFTLCVIFTLIAFAFKWIHERLVDIANKYA